jgi:hypothetical protein
MNDIKTGPLMSKANEPLLLRKAQDMPLVGVMVHLHMVVPEQETPCIPSVVSQHAGSTVTVTILAGGMCGQQLSDVEQLDAKPAGIVLLGAVRPPTWHAMGDCPWSR